MLLASPVAAAAADPLYEIGAALGAFSENEVQQAYPRDFGLSGSIGARGRFQVLTGFVEAGFATASTDHYRDPTFDFGPTRYWIMPVLCGFRANLEAPNRPGISRFDLGMAAVIALTHWDDVFGTNHSESTWGFAFDAGPGWAVNERWGVWLRARVMLLAPTSYGDAVGSVNHSRAELRLGTWFGRGGTVRPDPLADRSAP